ncbi:MAG: cytochrome c oxidase subunit II [Dehalococcoidia bacterium]
MGRSGPGRIIALVVSLGITLAVTGILYYWFRESAFLGNDFQSTFEPASENAQKIHDVYVLVFWLAGAVFVGVLALTLAFSLMFREQEGAEAVQTHGNSRLEILWTFIPVVIVVVMAVPTFDAIVQIEGDPPADALEVTATGHQWWFEFEYAEEGIVTATDLHVVEGRPVHVRLVSDDVIHSFWVPRLMGKKDMMPGHVNEIWFTPSEAGVYLGQCAEFCGLSHAKMRFRVIVHSAEDYDAWVASIQSGPTLGSDDELVQRGQEVFSNPASQCIACHTVETISAGAIGPNLTHIGARSTLAGGWLDNTPEEMAAWIADPASVKPGSLMPDTGLSDEDIQAVVAFLQSLQ